MPMSEHIQEIIRHIGESFGNIEAPNYVKVSVRLEARSTWPELSSIIQVFWTKDVTDSNDDISMCLLLKDGIDEFALELSAVGPYAILMRLQQGKCHLMSLEEMKADARLTEALAATVKSRTFLSQSILEMEIPFGENASGPVYPRIYNALFSDTEVLPWAN